MSSAAVTFDFVASTTIQSGQVDQNFADLVSFLNTHVVHNHPDQWPASMPRGLQGTIKTLGANVGPTSGGTFLVILTADAFTPVSATRKIKLTLNLRSLGKTVASDDFVINFQRDGAYVGSRVEQVVVGVQETANEYGGAISIVDDSPSAVSHVYRVGIERIAGTGTATVHGGANYFCQFWVEDIGGT